MATTAHPTPTTTSVVPDIKDQFLSSYEDEVKRTIRVLRSLPPNASELRPADKLRTARELAWVFVIEQAMAAKALTTGFDWSNPGPVPPAPDSMDAVITAFDEGHQQVAGIVRSIRAEDLLGTVQFFVGPKKLGDMTKISFLWMTLCDQIHHRGQFSIYVRIAGGTLPSIYGPTADEPWD